MVILRLVGILLATQLAFAADFPIVRSHPLEVIHFMEALNGEFGRTTSFNLNSEKYPEARAALREFKAFQMDLSNQARTTPKLYPLDSDYNDINKRILAAAVEFPDETQFLDWLRKNLHPDDFNRWLTLYKKMKPIYDETYGNPLEHKASLYRNQLLETAKEWKIKEKLECASKFYDGDLQKALSSPVAVVPISEETGVVGESVIGRELIVANPTSTNYDSDFTVVFHEKLHTLFSSRSPAMKDRIRKNLRLNDSTESQQLLKDFDEALATYIGNVWAYQKATGVTVSTTDSWYNDDRIDSNAKALAPLIEKMLENCEPMDDKFLTEAARILRANMPTSATDSNHTPSSESQEN